MDRQQLLQLINQRILASEAAEAAATSLSLAMRQVEHQLLPLRSAIAQPALPLPSAECVAAFVEGQVNQAEQSRVIAAAVHDVGILFQLVNAVQSLADAPSRVPSVGPELRQRLLAIPRHSQVAIPPSIAPPAANPFVNRQRVADSSRHHNAWLLVAVCVAACCLVAVGWIAMTWSIKNSPAEDLRAARPRPSNVEGGTVAETIHMAASEERLPAPPQGAEEDVLAERQADDTRPFASPATALAHEEKLEAIEDSVPESGVTPIPFETEVATVPNATPNNSAVADASAFPPEKQEQGPAIVWTDITGVLASGIDEAYDKWLPVKVRTAATSQPRATSDSMQDETQHHAQPTRWLTLSTCFAKGELTNGGHIVVDEDTSFRATRVGDRATWLEVDFGSIVLKDMPKNSQLHFSELPTAANTLQIDATAGLQLQRVAGGLEVALLSGAVHTSDGPLPAGTTILFAGGAQRAMQQPAAMPAWAEKMPDSSALPRQVLANLDFSTELSESLDKQLFVMARNLNGSNRVAVSNFQNLCRWRADLAVENIHAVTAEHTLWPVRLAAFDMLLNDSRRLPALRARQALFRKLLALNAARNPNASAPAADRTGLTNGTSNLRSWLEMARGNRQANRQDLAEWLRLLANDDSELAAFGDYLLRKRFQGGPSFEPVSNARARAVAQKAWTKFVADNLQ